MSLEPFFLFSVNEARSLILDRTSNSSEPTSFLSVGPLSIIDIHGVSEKE
jgi:hypothetical protein